MLEFFQILTDITLGVICLVFWLFIVLAGFIEFVDRLTEKKSPAAEEDF